MTTYRVDFFEVEELWGYKNFHFDFDPDVNILIGPKRCMCPVKCVNRPAWPRAS